MTRIIPTVIIHLTGKEQLIKKREEKKRGLEVRGGGGCGGVKAGGGERGRGGQLVKQSRIRTLATGIPSPTLFEEVFRQARRDDKIEAN